MVKLFRISSINSGLLKFEEEGVELQRACYNIRMWRKNKNIFIVTILFIICVVLLFVYFRSISQKRNNTKSLANGETLITQQPVIAKDEKYITGTISSFSNELPMDGNCVVIVNDMKIAIAIGGDRIPTMIPKESGTVLGIECKGNSSLSIYIGRKIEAFGKWNGHYLTVEGNKNYYIQVK